MKKIYSLLLLAGICLFGAQNVMAMDYYVAHNGVLNGNVWDAAGDQMTETGGVWSCVFTNVSGDIQFKITVGSWGTSFGGSCKDNEASDFTLSGEGDENVFFSVSGKDVEIFWNPSTGKIWVKEYVTADPIVHLSANNANVLAGQTITLSAEAQNFSGTPTYAYSYSTDGGESYTSMAGNTMTAGESGTVYTFKVVATYNEETAEATVVVSSVVCTVAGQSANIFGEAWAQTLTDNDMDENDGVFTWKKTVYLSTAETMQFKVVLNHNWSVSYPTSNYEKALAAGYNTITITLDWSTKDVACEVLNYPKVELTYGFDGQDWTDVEMVWDGTSSCSTTVEGLLQDYVYAYKIKVNGVLCGNTGKMYRHNCQGWSMSSGESTACHILTDETGNYKFTYIGGLVSVDYPETYTRNFDVVKYGTICLPQAATLSNAKVYNVDAEHVSEGYITISEKAEASVEAGVPYIIRPIEVGNVVATFEGTTTNELTNNLLIGNIIDAQSVAANANNYVLSADELHYVDGEGVTVGLYRAYLHIDNATAPALRVVVAENGATAIENIEANETAQKFIENGKLFIQKNGVVYDATGAIVK